MTIRRRDQGQVGDPRSPRRPRPLATLEELVDARHTSGDTSGALVVRAWFEEGQLRARVTSTTDLRAPDETVVVAADRETVLAAVRAWLDALEQDRL
jgi:hypothetical protein